MIAVPCVLIYARILSLFPGEDIFSVAQTVLGKVAGKIAVALMSWFALHLGALVLRNFSEFISKSLS